MVDQRFERQDPSGSQHLHRRTGICGFCMIMGICGWVMAVFAAMAALAFAIVYFIASFMRYNYCERVRDPWPAQLRMLCWV